MFLFFISLFLTVLLGFFVSSIFEQKNLLKIFVIFCLTMFASIILNIEILSLFSKISKFGILSLNLIMTSIGGYIWYKKGKKKYEIKYKRFFKKLFYALMSDKCLLILGLAFVFMCSISLFLISFLPTTSADAASYHVLRSFFWASNGSLNHFYLPDIRNIVMPINSEILYLWLYTFIKKDIWFGIFSFFGFLLTLCSLYGIMTYAKIKERAKLWVLFIIFSLPSVITQISGTETDIIISGLVLAFMYLYWSYLKSNKIPLLYFASLSFAIALGVKATSFFLAIPVAIWVLWLGWQYNKKDFYKPFLKLAFFGLINFVIFSSYNYVLNFIDYQNFFGPEHFRKIHSNIFGIKGAIAGFIKHMFSFFDFTGFTWNKTFGVYILNFKHSILNFLNLSNIPDGIYAMKDEMNGTLLEPCMGMGILGFILYLPCFIWALLKPLFSKQKINYQISSFAYILLLTIIIESIFLIYMQFNIRFLTSFCIISAIVLVYSYSKKFNIFKFIITVFALFGLLLVSTHLWARSFVKIIYYTKQSHSIKFVRNLFKYYNLETYYLIDILRTFKPDSKILYFPNTSELLTNIKLLENEGYSIDYGNANDFSDIDFKKYDIIITLENAQITDNFQFPNKCEYIKYNYDYNLAYRIICLLPEEKFTSKGFELYDTKGLIKNYSIYVHKK